MASGDGTTLPIVIDFDRAVLRRAALSEQVIAIVKTRPGMIPRLLLAAVQGGDAMREAVRSILVDQSSSEPPPLRQEIETLVAAARDNGQDILWVSRADGRPVVVDGDPLRGPVAVRDGPAERAALDADVEGLATRFPNGFAYVGGTDADLPAWRRAWARYGIDLSPDLRHRAQAEGLGIVEICRPASRWKAAIRSMRPHQWLKNALLFVPFALDVQELHLRDGVVAVLAFLCLCALTSGTYIVNDLFDIDADRRHPRKRKRPIASGDLPVTTALMVATGLILGAILCACLLRYAFTAALVSYLLITLAYSFRLKRMAMVDVLVIALLFTLRILAGMLLVSETPSHWLLMFSIFFFLSLAFMKRDVEFNVIRRAGRTTLSGRGYDLDDRLYVLCCGLSSGIASVVIFSLFITATIDRTQLNYRAPELLWGVMGLVGYWVLRMWMLTTRGLMNDDPILFAARDPTSLVLGAICAALAVCSQVIHL